MGVLALASCSTQKNTKATRAYHSMKVKYNIYYNGSTSYDKGLEAIAKANTDDYTQVLPLYPVSNHTAALASASDMDRTIEKCRKCIKLHSIKKKPQADPKKSSDPAYRAWLKQEEFNPSMPKAWLLLGKAEFHKGDFLESVGTFNYIQKHFDYDKDVIAQCQLWSVRAYAESDWVYEAEDLLQKVKVDDLKRKNAALYSAVTADLKLRQGLYKEAVPHIKIAMEEEKRKGNRPRFAYVLAQIYEMDGQKDIARAYYKKVINMYPKWDMDFNARLHLAQLEPNSAAGLKSLKKMAALDKYKDHLDEIYGAMGNICLQKKDTAAALEYYEKGIEGSTQAGYAKAEILVKAGDLYFEQKNYVKAQPCYTEASTILTTTNSDYARVKKRSEVLDELVVEYNTVQLQDSLQRLSLLSDEDQMKVAEKIVADLIEKEKQDSINAAAAARNAQNNTGLQSVNTQNMLGGSTGSKEWYFYNQNLLKQGKQQFRQKWGNRTLEDNWRRMIKSQISSPVDSEESGDEDLPEDSLSNDSTSAEQPQETVSDIHDPRYYLQQIPKTEDDIKASNDMIATSLYNMVGIYQDKLEDQPLADETMAELKRRFPTDARLADLTYSQYLTALKQNDTIAAETYRQTLLREYPDCSYATVLKDPQYFAKLRQMAVSQDSLYEATYEAYKKSDYATVKANKEYADTAYSLSPLMPRFLFLNAVATAKTQGQDAFVTELRDLVNRYPSSELGAMGKDMLAMMNQGMESQQGGTTSSLADKRQEMSEEQQQEDTVEVKDERPVVLLVIAKDEQNLNTLLFQVALYNFSQFMIKDFDLRTELNYSETQSALEVSGFDTKEETSWYAGLLRENTDLAALFEQLNVEIKY